MVSVNEERPGMFSAVNKNRLVSGAHRLKILMDDIFVSMYIWPNVKG